MTSASDLNFESSFTVRTFGPEEIIDVVLRDRAYYAASGGGMTISGGEPTFQPEFALALARAARTAGVHCAIETSGYVEWKSLEPLAVSPGGAFKLLDRARFNENAIACHAA